MRAFVGGVSFILHVNVFQRRDMLLPFTTFPLFISFFCITSFISNSFFWDAKKTFLQYKVMQKVTFDCALDVLLSTECLLVFIVWVSLFLCHYYIPCLSLSLSERWNDEGLNNEKGMGWSMSLLQSFVTYFFNPFIYKYIYFFSLALRFAFS